MNNLLKTIDSKRKELATFEPLPVELVKNLDEWFRVELTYTSNAIEGNTLTRQETALVVEKNVAVEGKSLQEIQEAVNHAAAYNYVKDLVKSKPERTSLTERDILEIHGRILKSIDDTNAGRYRTVTVRVAGSQVVFPNPVKVPELMEQFYTWLTGKRTDHIATIAADAHYKFVSIHPHTDGNGRTARLLMNLLLMQAGLPPAVIAKEERSRYLTAVERGQTTGDLGDYYQLVYEALNRSLDLYLPAANPPPELDDAPANEPIKEGLLKIGEVAERTGEHFSTIRFWSQQGLLDVAEYSPGGYRLFAPDVIDTVKEINRLKHEERLTLPEIRIRLDATRPTKR